MTSRAGERARAGGFTLLELLVVLVILGLTVTLAVPVFTHAAPGIEAKAAARDVAATLRTARSLAIAGNREVAVVVDPERHSIELAGARGQTIPAAVGISLFTAAEELVDRGAGGIRFYPDGTSTGGRVRFSAGGRNYDVLIDWITGRVTIHD